MHRHVLAFAVAGLLSARGASAQVPPVPAPPQGVSLGVRAAWGIPVGNLDSGLSAGSAFTGALPLQLDLGYRFDRHFSAGFYFSYAPGFANDCPPGGTCSATSTRFGLQATYTLDPQGSLRPWFGISVGYEWISLEQTVAGLTASDTLSGFEWANLQVGGDVALTARLFLGPYAAISFGTLSNSDAGSIPASERRLHEWITVGLRAYYEF